MTADFWFGLLFFLGLPLIAYFFKEPFKPTPDDRYLINDPSLPQLDLSGWGFEKRDGRLQYKYEQLNDFPGVFNLSQFSFSPHHTEEIGETKFLIYGWKLKNLD